MNQISNKQSGAPHKFSILNSDEHEQVSSGYESPARNSVIEIEKPGIKVASQDLTYNEPLPSEIQEESPDSFYQHP